MLELRMVKKGEEELALNFIDEARVYLKEQGIEQWQNGYPSMDTIKEDVEFLRGYFIVKDNKEIGYICVDIDGKAGYQEIDGEWKASGRYSVINRMTISKKSRDKGLADAAFKLAEEISTKRNVNIIRIATDISNKKMQHIIGKLEYYHCGNIVSADGGIRLAYEKVIEM